MKKFFIMLIIFFICGFISADLYMTELQKSNILLQLEVYKEYANAKLLFKDIFWNILYERIKLFIILGLLCVSPIRERIIPVLLSFFSFIWGFFFMNSIVELGIAGLVVGVVAVFPHGILYIISIAMMFRVRKRRGYYNKSKYILHVSEWAFMLLLFITGCVIESLIGTYLIPWIIRLSLI